jgi:hypothetical protein
MRAQLKQLKTNRRAAGARGDLEHIDAVFLREMGLNAEDFRDAFEGRRKSVLFTPFRDSPKR